MNLISVKLHKRLGQENLSRCIRISKYPLSDVEYKDIYCIWFSAEEAKSGSRKVVVYVKDA